MIKFVLPRKVCLTLQNYEETYIKDQILTGKNHLQKFLCFSSPLIQIMHEDNL